MKPVCLCVRARACVRVSVRVSEPIAELSREDFLGFVFSTPQMVV